MSINWFIVILFFWTVSANKFDMETLNHTVDVAIKPVLELLDNMMTECLDGNASHSEILLSQEVDGGRKNDEDIVWCPRTFDGFACWDATPASATATQPCPEIVVGFDPTRFAYKTCTADGSWFKHPEGKKPWTNYTTCIDFEDLGFRSIVNIIYVVGYSVSVAALLLSISIFLYFRTLQCIRIKIHLHLFVAFAMNNILWIVWYKTVIDKVSVVQNNEASCQILHIVTNYFMLSSYSWMFCEALHLHIALVVVFVRDESTMRWFITTGWGMPFIIVGAYSTVRYNTPGATARCWMDLHDTSWIIVVPVLISLIVSFLFMVNVVRVLVMKLNPITHDSLVAAKKAVRATLILIPLFGLHFLLIPLMPAPNTPGERIYQVASAIITSLQGLCVSVLFCFTNQEVIVVVKASVTRALRMNETIAMTGVTAGESLMNVRENVV